MDSKEVWQTALGELEVVFSKANFRTWFKDTFILSLTEEEVIVGVPNAFAQDWLKDKYDKEIQEALKKVIPTLEKVSYKVSTQTAAPKPTVIHEESPKKEPEITHPQLNHKYRFCNFIIGNSNRLAAATAQAISSKPGTVYNPLFLYGGVGLGKTHLVQAIGNEILAKNPKKKIVYVSCERFTNDFIQSISNGRINNFKKAYRDVDVLLVDDIQFLSGKE
ncbi:MAG: DnaA/Hda family protein, partial [Patescibacteria group bacterium]